MKTLLATCLLVLSIPLTAAFSLSDLTASIFQKSTSLKITPDSVNLIFEQEQLFRLEGDRFFYQGDFEKALEKYNQSLAIIPYKFESLYNKACVLSLLNRTNEALQTLKIAAMIHNYAIDLAERDPDFENLKNNPDFQALLRWKE